MSATEQTPGVDEESSPVSLCQCYDKTFSASAPIGEAVLSTAIAADSRQEATFPIPEGSLTPQILQQDDPLYAHHDGQ
jgi:hypothetical protein